MDVKKNLQILLTVFILLSCAACAKRTSEDVFQERSQSTPCTETKIAGQYLVKWEDGRISLEHGKNDDSFVKDFLEPNLEKIRRVEYNKTIRIRDQEVLVAPYSDIEAQAASSTWGQTMTEVKAMWNLGYKGKDVKVAVVDTPVDYTHAYLKNRVLKADDGTFGWDFDTNAPAQPATIANHGSHVSGIISSDHTTLTKLGIAPEAKLIISSFLGDDGGGTMEGAIKALKYAGERGARIINASWGGGKCSTTLRETIQELSDAGVIVVVASGNDGLDLDKTPDYPAIFQSAHQITVAAIRDNGTMESFSNTSFRYVNIAAPGVDIYSMLAKNSLGYMSGTSMAAPFVSGAAALLWGTRPAATATQVKQALLSSIVPGNYRVSSQGRLNIKSAIAEIERLVPAPSAPAQASKP